MFVENLFSIKGKTALVTGGSRGIGEMIASGFCANGAKVYITARSKDTVLPSISDPATCPISILKVDSASVP